MTLYDCIKCGKSTRSHDLGEGIYMCHNCYTSTPDEKIEEMKNKIRERKAKKIKSVLKGMLEAKGKMMEGEDNYG